VILADTSVWIELFRSGGRTLRELLEAGQIVMHDLILGELACGSLNDRQTTLRLLKQLPSIPPAQHQEVMDFVELNRLYGLGLGWIDMHLLAAARLGRCELYTLDRRLGEAARQLHIGMA
jgi:predicted nucleic acid-binding protein